MNSAKKIMNQQAEDAKKASKKTEKTATAAKGDKKISDGGVGDTKRIVIGAICAVIILVLCIGVGVQQLKPKVVLTVNDKKFTMEDMMYPIYERESMYLPYDEMYQMYTGSSVWDNSYMGSDRNVDSSATNSVGLKQEVIDVEVEYYVLYEKAKEAGYTLTDEEKSEVKDEVEEALKGLSWLQKVQLSISKKKLTTRFEQRKLAEKYKNDEQDSLNASVDEDAAIKDISKKDYREYKLAYYAVSVNDTTDEEGNTVSLTSKEKQELLEKLEKVYNKAKTADDFEGLTSDDEEDIQYSETSFTEQDGFSMISTSKYLKDVKALKNGEMSDIIKDEKSGYYLFVKMEDNNSSEAYDEACDSAITAAQNEAYDTWYQGILEDYKVSTNSDVWDDVVIGTVTTDIVTAEDLEKMNEDSSDATSE